MVGWRSFADREPNAGHAALCRLQQMGRLDLIITQNVDRLHTRAGSTQVIELHGRTDELVCMHCDARRDRREFQQELEVLNAEWLEQQQEKTSSQLRPDGDAELFTDDFSALQIPSCTTCDTGFLKPNVVFFGDSVPLDRVEQCRAAVAACDGLLVVGSSLAVHSAYRHVRAAHAAGTPICIVNVGPTRAEKEGLEGILKIEAPLGVTLAGLVDELSLDHVETLEERGA